MKIKLSITQNAFHSLHHAIEHLALASQIQNLKGRTFDDDSHCVVETLPDGKQSFYVGGHYTKPPARYNYKFAILHLIQAMELLVKGYLYGIEPKLIFESVDKSKTISLKKGLRELVKQCPDLLTPDQVALICQANDVRNFVEHFEFSYSVEAMRAMASDFLAVCNYLAFRLFNVSLVDEFSWDPWTESYDRTGDVLSEYCSSLGQPGVTAIDKMVLLWQFENLEDKIFLCFRCGSRAASSKKGACIVCGSDTNEEIGKLTDELHAIAQVIRAIKSRSGGT